MADIFVTTDGARHTTRVIIDGMDVTQSVKRVEFSQEANGEPTLLVEFIDPRILAKASGENAKTKGTPQEAAKPDGASKSEKRTIAS